MEKSSGKLTGSEKIRDAMMSHRGRKPMTKVGPALAHNF